MTTTSPQRFCCEICDYKTSRSDNFAKHNLTAKHLLLQKNGENMEKVGSYVCTMCKFSTNTMRDFNRHTETKKHKDRETIITIESLSDNKKDTHNSNFAIECQKQMVESQKQMFESQKQMFDYLDRKDQEFKSLVLELCKNVQTNNTMIQQINTNSNNNNTTNSNNSFNLQVFLNETCKDAVNLSEFIRSVKVSFEDMERVAQLGYVEGLSEVIIKNLNALGVERRPIHCTDAKRQIIYVKEDDKWEKEDEKMHHIQFLIDEIQKANLRQLAKWRDAHPSCLTSNSIYTDSYNHMSQELLGGDCKRVNMATKDSRIMSKIAKEMTIDKAALGLLK